MQYIFLSYFTAKKNIKHKFLLLQLTSRKHFFFIFQIYVNKLGNEKPDSDTNCWFYIFNI